jgi:phosphoribosylformylglycinamidine synthase
MSSFVASLSGMNEICRSLVTPIISGNVSFYNETEGRGITPTPSTGIVGLRPSVDHLAKGHFTRAGDNVYLLRLPQLYQNGVMSEIRGEASQAFGTLNGDGIAKFAKSLRALTNGSDGSKDSISASRMVGKFGLGYALARMMIPAGLGVKVDEARLRAARPELANMKSGDQLFTEISYELLIVSRESEQEIRTRWVKHGGNADSLFALGSVGGSSLALGDALNVGVVELKQCYETGWTKAFEHLPARG